jgi:hypothetical protein
VAEWGGDRREKCAVRVPEGASYIRWQYNKSPQIDDGRLKIADLYSIEMGLVSF